MGITTLHIIQELKERLSHVDDEIGQIRSRLLQMEEMEWGGVTGLVVEAEKVARVRKGWSRRRIAEEGNRLMEACRSYAITQGIALDEEGEAALGD